MGDEATYFWGSVFYAKGHLVEVRRIRPPRPYQRALAELGLSQDINPFVRAGDETLIWADRPFHSGITGRDGLVIDSAFIPKDFSEFQISILDADFPKSWTDDECLMWLRMSGSPIPEAAMQRGNMLDWPIHHDNTPQACKSRP